MRCAWDPRRNQIAQWRWVAPDKKQRGGCENEAQYIVTYQHVRMRLCEKCLALPAFHNARQRATRLDPTPETKEPAQ
jgi:hypothetical protein